MSNGPSSKGLRPSAPPNAVLQTDEQAPLLPPHLAGPRAVWVMVDGDGLHPSGQSTSDSIAVALDSTIVFYTLNDRYRVWLHAEDSPLQMKLSPPNPVAVVASRAGRYPIYWDADDGESRRDEPAGEAAPPRSGTIHVGDADDA